MANKSAHLLAKQLEADINKSLRRVDLQDYDAATRKLLTVLKREATDVRLDARDYEFAETRIEQIKLGAGARKRLEAVRNDMLTASQYNIFSVVEVAELSARVDYLLEQLD